MLGRTCGAWLLPRRSLHLLNKTLPRPGSKRQLQVKAETGRDPFRIRQKNDEDVLLSASLADYCHNISPYFSRAASEIARLKSERRRTHLDLGHLEKQLKDKKSEMQALDRSIEDAERHIEVHDLTDLLDGLHLTYWREGTRYSWDSKENYLKDLKQPLEIIDKCAKSYHEDGAEARSLLLRLKENNLHRLAQVMLVASCFGFFRLVTECESLIQAGLVSCDAVSIQSVLGLAVSAGEAPALGTLRALLTEWLQSRCQGNSSEGALAVQLAVLQSCYLIPGSTGIRVSPHHPRNKYGGITRRLLMNIEGFCWLIGVAESACKLPAGAAMVPAFVEGMHREGSRFTAKTGFPGAGYTGDCISIANALLLYPSEYQVKADEIIDDDKISRIKDVELALATAYVDCLEYVAGMLTGHRFPAVSGQAGSARGGDTTDISAYLSGLYSLIRLDYHKIGLPFCSPDQTPSAIEITRRYFTPSEALFSYEPLKGTSPKQDSSRYQMVINDWEMFLRIAVWMLNPNDPRLTPLPNGIRNRGHDKLPQDLEVLVQLYDKWYPVNDTWKRRELFVNMLDPDRIQAITECLPKRIAHIYSNILETRSDIKASKI